MNRIPDLSVVVPILNEEDTLWDSLTGLAVHLDHIVGPGRWEYLLVDNGSSDQSPEIITRAEGRWPGSRGIRLACSDFGQALYSGLEASRGGYALIVNVDWWDPPFIAWAWRHRQRYDIFIGSKRADPTLNRQGKLRIMLSWGLNALLQLMFSYVATDTHGQKLIKLSTMRPILSSCVMRRGQFDTEFTIKAFKRSFWIAEAPVPLEDTRKPRNTMIRKVLQNVLDLYRLKRVIRATTGPPGPVRLHRYCREDLEREAGELPSGGAGRDT